MSSDIVLPSQVCGGNPVERARQRDAGLRQAGNENKYGFDIRVSAADMASINRDRDIWPT
jgi:hypothetical protein